jgi:hypothetical protein
MEDNEIVAIMDAIDEMSKKFNDWSKDYDYNNESNEFYHKTKEYDNKSQIEQLLNI